MNYRTFSRVIFSCFFLAACASSSNIVPSSVPTQNKKTVKQKNFKFESQDAGSLVRLAKGFKQSGDIISALNYYGQATVVNPGLLEPWLGIIELLRDFDNRIGARDAIKDARRYHANDPDLALIAAEIEIADDKATDAITILSPYMGRQDYRFSNLLGVASEMMGSPTIARKYYNEAIGYNAAAAGITDNLALSFSFYNDPEKAIALLQKNLDVQNNRKLSYETLAIIYAMDNQLDAALNIARTVLSDEEVSNNYSFYQALYKLPPAMRARAVFTRSLPADANPYLSETVQKMAEPVQKMEEPEKNNDLTKAEMARQLVNRRNETSATKSQETNPQQDTTAPAKEIVPAKENVEINNKVAGLPVLLPAPEPQASVDNELTEENKSITATTVEDSVKTEEKQEPITEQNLPEISSEPTTEVSAQEKTIEPDDAQEEKTEPEDVKALHGENELVETAMEARDAYRVQIAAYTTMPDAQKDWCRISKRVMAAEVNEQPNVRIIGEGQDIRYRLLLGEYDNRADADATCEALKTQKLGCYVVKGAGQLRPLESDCQR